MNSIIDIIEKPQCRTDIPNFKSGDTVRVHAKIIEGDKERIQVFEGVVISRANAGNRASFTVRKISYGVGVERVFPLHSPRIDKIELVTIGRVRRAKLYYLRNLSGKAARIKGERVISSSKAQPTIAPPPEVSEVIEEAAVTTEETSA